MAGTYAYGEHSAIIEYQVPEGQRALWMRKVSGIRDGAGGENNYELALPRGLRARIVGIEDRGIERHGVTRIIKVKIEEENITAETAPKPKPKPKSGLPRSGRSRGRTLNWKLLNNVELGTTRDSVLAEANDPEALKEIQAEIAYRHANLQWTDGQRRRHLFMLRALLRRGWLIYRSGRLVLENEPRLGDHHRSSLILVALRDIRKGAHEDADRVVPSQGGRAAIALACHGASSVGPVGTVEPQSRSAGHPRRARPCRPSRRSRTSSWTPLWGRALGSA